jgi:uncharacterized protein with HEPN domain
MVSMQYDKTLVVDILHQIIDTVESVKNKCTFAQMEDDFCDTEQGQEKLDSICMKLIAVGESLKNIDKITNKELLLKYNNVEWKKIKGVRDILSHHYFDLDANLIFDICTTYVDELLITLKQIRSDLS